MIVFFPPHARAPVLGIVELPVIACCCKKTDSQQSGLILSSVSWLPNKGVGVFPCCNLAGVVANHLILCNVETIISVNWYELKTIISENCCELMKLQ